ncbi:MAG: citrate lyase subunit alpha [Clostridia bacterium]|nr:citrate lyase subunit alpha [Clostridia bacterium]
MDKQQEIKNVAQSLNMKPYKKGWNSATHDRSYVPRIELQTQSSKLVDLETAIMKSGLKDGMTISFHHHFREGDKIINMVVDKLAQMGYRDLQLASSSLSDVHAPLIKHIQNGVITRIQTSGLRGELADAISHGLMDNPVIFRSHGGRAAAIENGELHIDVAFLGASSCDYLGNANGYSRSGREKSICGSLGYAKVDAENADKVIILTDNIVTYPNVPVTISEGDVDYIVLVDEVGDASKISSGAIRDTKNPHDILLAETAAKVVEHSGYFYDGFSLQTGSGGASLAVTKYLREAMITKNIKARYALGGITSHMVKLHEEGLIDKLLDVQSFDLVAATSLKNNRFHQQISASTYANPFENGSAINWLDVVILSALEVDTEFNVNVLTGSNGVIRGAIGGHPDTAAGAALSIVVVPLIRGRIPCVVDKVTTLITTGDCVDVVVTDQGVAVNPARPEIEQRLRKAKLPIMSIQELKDKAESVIGKPDSLVFGEKIVGVVTSRDGAVLDTIHQIIDEQI